MEETFGSIIAQLIALLPNAEQIVKFVAGWFLVEKTLIAIAEFTKWKWDDNLVKLLGKIVRSILPEKKPSE